MDVTGRAGRLIGFALFLQMAGSGLVNGALEAPLFGTPGFLVNAAPHAEQIGLAALLGVLTQALWVVIAVLAFPVISRGNQALALWLTALSVAGLAAGLVENTAVMSMVSLSQAYTKAAPADPAALETLRVVVASARNWPHFMARIVDGAIIFSFHAALLRLGLVPQVLAGLGLLAATSMVISVTLPFFGHAVIFAMLAPLGLVQLALSVWLMVKGFREHAPR